MKVGIVILNYKTPLLTYEIVKKCVEYSAIDEIVVVDNYSSNECIEELNNLLSKLDSRKLRIIFNPSNSGYACGNNIGLRKLSQLGCEICIISNPDVFFTNELIQELIFQFEKNNEYAVLTTARRMERKAEKIRQYWNIPSKKDLMMENLFFYQKLFKNKREIYKLELSEDVIEIEVAPGAFFAIKTDVLEKIGYLDEHTFLYFEENCLAVKIRDVGFKIGIISKIDYVCLDRNKNSTSQIHTSTFGRKCYIASKEYFCRNYLKMNGMELLLLRILDRIFIFEKWIAIYFRIHRR